MNEMEQLLEKALKLEQQGEKDEALETLSHAFDILIDEAGAYAKAQESTVTDPDELRAMAPVLIEHSTVFLRQNLTAAMILNNMGLLFGELGQYDAAVQKFEEAVRLTPANTEFDDPSDNLQAVLMKIAELNAPEEETALDG
ncbi:MAG TPA: tetratricopeptide repeat protein [Candidatus Paceibacterota bacterium]